MAIDSSGEKERRRVLPKVPPSPEDYIMGCLFMLSAASKDPFDQQAAWLINNKDQPGFFFVNTLAYQSYSSQKLSWDGEDRHLGLVTAVEGLIDKQLKHSCHSSYGDSLTGWTIYTLAKPSLRCVRKCAIHGIKTIVYGKLETQTFDEQDWADAKRLASVNTINLKEFQGNLNWMRDRQQAYSYLF